MRMWSIRANSVLCFAVRAAGSGKVIPKSDAVSSGSLVFGGGHVVLPLLQADLVPSGWVDHDAFLAGYGAAQAVPGPVFTFAAFLGASMNQAPSGWSRWQSVAPLR